MNSKETFIKSYYIYLYMGDVVISKPRCDRCNSTQVYFRRTTNEQVCHTCGNVESLNTEEENN